MPLTTIDIIPLFFAGNSAFTTFNQDLPAYCLKFVEDVYLYAANTKEEFQVKEDSYVIPYDFIFELLDKFSYYTLNEELLNRLFRAICIKIDMDVMEFAIKQKKRELDTVVRL